MTAKVNGFRPFFFGGGGGGGELEFVKAARDLGVILGANLKFV